MKALEVKSYILENGKALSNYVRCFKEFYESFMQDKKLEESHN